MAKKKLNIPVWESAKWWFKSTTIWVNLIPVIILLIEYVAKVYIIDPELVVILAAIVNILRRFQAPDVVQPLKIK